jgi:hypothetical protein
MSLDKNLSNEKCPKIYSCDFCDFVCFKKSNWERHINTSKHQKRAGQTEQKMDSYYCSICNVKCSYKSMFLRHLQTTKHRICSTSIERAMDWKNEDLVPSVQAPSPPKTYSCKICSKKYTVYKSYWEHQRKCSLKNKNANTNEQKPENVSLSDLFSSNNNKETQNMYSFMTMIIKEVMSEQMKTVVEIAKNSSVSNSNNTLVQTNNTNKFNINVFLNEKCKDAMNLSEFLDSIVVTQEDLENNARLGFVNGMTKIIMDNMKKQDILERSMHCTDFKRETFYIKDNDKWTKEDTTNKLNSAINEVSKKSIKTLTDWRKLHPDCQNYDSDFYKNCNNIILNSVAGVNRETYYPRIIKNIARETTLDKDNLLIS